MFSGIPQILKISNDKAKSNEGLSAYKRIAFSLYVPLHYDAILTHDCILRNTTEWLRVGPF